MPYYSPLTPGSVEVEVECYASQAALKCIVLPRFLLTKIVLWINRVITFLNIQNL